MDSANEEGKATATTDRQSGDYGSTGHSRRLGKPVLTPLGKEVDSYSEEHRAWCEAKHVMNITKKVDRQRYMGDILRIRGEKAHKDLAEKILALWKLSKS